MIYGKLPVVFLSVLTSEKKDSTNHQIATYILEHIDEMQNIGIQDLAKRCHVAMSSISRFCKEIGLKDFAQLKELLADSNFYFEEQSQSTSLQVRVRDYGQKIYESIQMVESSLNLKQLISLCQDLYQYQRVGIFGLLKAQTAAMNLQTDLLMTGKQVKSYVSYFQQMDYILNADENDLIIILSYTGSYFEYENLRVLQKKLEAPKIWMITSVQENYPYFVDEVLTFQSLQDQGSHPYQLQFIASLIAQEYNYRYKI